MHHFEVPEPRPQVGQYTLDSFTIEEDEAGDFDFRLELGEGLSMYWALPAPGGDRLRLFLMGYVAADIDEPVMERDPFAADFGPMTLQGKPGAPIESVTIELTENPPGYVCVVFPRGRAPVELRWPLSE
jgi:hypothetical protein